MLKGFKNFLMRGDIIVVAVGLIIALAFSTLILAFTDNVINPIIARAQGGQSAGLGWQLGQAGNKATYLNLGAFISALIYFIVFMAVVYFLIVLPYKAIQARRGMTVFGDPAPLKTCPACLAADLPEAASKCRYCGTAQPTAPAAGPGGGPGGP
ncbi:MscL family protein [Streptomyces sparsogenes]|uniref:large conductance mechanosensitive channel protein MscL n=1 Tax=Streptomyces sparsogenes TaxID=67365 RepID=UPI0033F42E7C